MAQPLEDRIARRILLEFGADPPLLERVGAEQWDPDRTWVWSKFSGFRAPIGHGFLVGQYLRQRSDGQIFYVNVPLRTVQEKYVEIACCNALLKMEEYRTCSCSSRPESFCIWHTCQYKEPAD